MYIVATLNCSVHDQTLRI